MPETVFRRTLGIAFVVITLNQEVHYVPREEFIP